MKQTFLLVIALCFTALAIQSCKKSKEPEPDNPWGLPNATQKGYNTFACRVNGENWISKKGIRNIGGGITDSTLGVRGTINPEDEPLEMFQIAIFYDLLLEERYLLNDTLKSYAEFYATYSNCFGTKIGYVRPKSYEGELILTKVDTINKIISGTFWFNILTDHCDTMKVTDGRFDINYY